MQPSSKKIIAILGPTSSGKSDYAIRLAKEIDGEVISVDSRQVYRGMDIGTGKVTRDDASCHPERNEGSHRITTSAKNSEIPRFTRNDNVGKSMCLTPYFSEGVRHHLLDVASPKRDYNVTHFLRDAKKAIADIEKRGKVPILCGGTTFWVEALLFGASFPEVKPDKQLRAKLDKLSAEELFAQLLEKDPERAATIDQKNKVRLIRALEIIGSLGKVPAIKGSGTFFPKGKNMYLTPYKVIALNPPKEILHARIESRLKERLKQGMIEEVKRLHKEGVSWKRLEGFGLEYRWCARYLQGKISRETMEAELLKENKRYAKRQLTFLRRLERAGIPLEWKEN